MPHTSTSKTVRCCAIGGLALVLLGSTACTVVSPIERNHGYLVDKKAIDSVEIGKDTKATLSKKMGTPSSTGTFDPNVWYYISQKEESFAFLRPDTVKQNIMEVHFGKDGRVASIKRYDVSDTHRIAYVSRETPTRGRELSFWEQMFGNVGRGLPGAAAGNDKTPGGGHH